MTWKEERRIEFLEECEEWPVTIKKNGQEAIGTKTPDSIISVMQPASYLTNIQSMFSLLNEDAERLGFHGLTRKRFTCDGIEYEWHRMQRDSSDATVQFFALKVI